MQTLSECDLDEETKVIDEETLVSHVACIRSRAAPEIQEECERLLADGYSARTVANVAAFAERGFSGTHRVHRDEDSEVTVAWKPRRVVRKDRMSGRSVALMVALSVASAALGYGTLKVVMGERSGMARVVSR
jgi:hypothetical protein